MVMMIDMPFEDWFALLLHIPIHRHNFPDILLADDAICVAQVTQCKLAFMHCDLIDTCSAYTIKCTTHRAAKKMFFFSLSSNNMHLLLIFTLALSLFFIPSFLLQQPRHSFLWQFNWETEEMHHQLTLILRQYLTVDSDLRCPTKLPLSAASRKECYQEWANLASAPALAVDSDFVLNRYTLCGWDWQRQIER